MSSLLYLLHPFTRKIQQRVKAQGEDMTAVEALSSLHLLHPFTRKFKHTAKAHVGAKTEAEADPEGEGARRGAGRGC